MLRALSSLYLFFSLCALLAAAFIYQTVFNTGVPVYGTPWFAALGLALAANIAACSLRRLKTAPAHFTLLHAGLVIIIAGAFATRFYRFEAKLPLHTGAASSKVYTQDASYELPFSVSLKDFRLEYYAEPRGRITVQENGAARVFDAREGETITTAGGATIKVLRVTRDFGLTAKNEVIDKSPYWHNPAVRLELLSGGKKKKLWFFGNFPGMHGQDLPYRVSYAVEGAEIKNFYSSILVKLSTGTEISAEVSVNTPLRYGGYTLYQTSYDPSDAGYSLLTVTMDRGVWVVYAGFSLLLLGIFLWLRK
ncbi:MAG TPA: hypothetical protein DCZ92_15630 [Elusimicrobia bacterium]|nr:MAG: hypothetical protein A2016_10090 [Elusimicrobia bacterium GWF2_62_30]HBA62211.1 hypothetical protein [Elusimicrobiota bacterium]